MYRGSSVRTAVVALAVLSGRVTNAWAQQGEVGRIDRIAEIIGGGKDRRIKDTTSDIRVRRSGTPSWVSTRAGDKLFFGDRLSLKKHFDVQVRVERKTQRGVLTFVPELVGRDGTGVRWLSTAAAGREIQDAAYQMTADPNRSEDFAVSIERGSLVLDWRHGPLAVSVAGHQFNITGTRVVVTVYPGGEEALVLLVSGSVTFMEAPTLGVLPGQVLHLRVGQPPEVLSPQAVPLQQVRAAAEFDETVVWSKFKPFWMKPAFFMPAVAIVAGGAYLAVSGTNTKQGSVTIKIP